MNANSAQPPKYIRYVAAQEGAKPKIIRMVEVQKDPMEPAKFKINQKIPGPPPSPPAPVMHSPPRKSNPEEQIKWKVPPCVSSWKNPRGYTVALDKRCAFNGRNGAQPEMINAKFDVLSTALSISTSQHRKKLEEIKEAERLLAEKAKERNQEKLLSLARQAREERAAVQRGLGHYRDDDDEDQNEDEARDRDRIREERHRERVRNANIKSGAPNKRTKFDRQRERDISEQIALGMARPNTTDNDVHDQRLYNQSQGIGSGFGEDDDYAVYDKAWKSQASFSSAYRPSESVANELKEHSQAAADNELVAGGSSRLLPGDDDLAPIQFESADKDTSDNNVKDIFNVESFLQNAKYNAKKQQQQQQKSYK